MSGHTSEEKIKILYEDSLRDVRNVSKRMEDIAREITGAAALMGRGKSIIREENEKIILKAVDDLRVVASQIILVRNDLNKTASDTVRELLAGEQGLLKKLTFLIQEQHAALGWISRAAEFYEKNHITSPLIYSSLIGGLIGGGLVACVVKLT